MQQGLITDFDKVCAFGESINLVIGAIIPPDITKTYWCDASQFYIEIPKVAKYHLVITDNTLFIEPHPTLNNLYPINTWLYGTVFAYLLQIRGYLVLHGSAVMVNDKAVIFSGGSGAGKSTTAAAMVARGHSLITDDVVALCYNTAGDLVVVPGPQRVKLWDDALIKFGISLDDLPQVTNKFNKYELEIENYQSEPVVVANFFELNHSEDCQKINFVQQIGHSKISTLIKNTYRYEMLRSMGKIPQHFKQVVKLASSINVYSVTRPQNQYLLDELLLTISQQL